MKNTFRSLIAYIPVCLLAVGMITLTTAADSPMGVTENGIVHFPVTTIVASEIQDSVRGAATDTTQDTHRHTQSNVVTQTTKTTDDDDHNHVADVQTETNAQPVQPSEPTVNTPYSLTNIGVDQDLASIGISQAWLSARSINVIASNGAIPKRCFSDGSSGNATVQGLAIRSVTYKSCNNGEQPLYSAYHDTQYFCSVVYNKQSSKKHAILAHELGHCVYHAYGDYGEFDIEYKKLRNVYELDQTGIRELIADDYMICQYGLNTNWSGNANYYTRYNVASPSDEQCTAFNELVAAYL